MPRPTLQERIERRLLVEGDCWIFTGSTTLGYGRVGVEGRTRQAHRLLYELLVGPIPDGLTLDHTCHNEAAARGECPGGALCRHRACCNPAHLEPTTLGENLRRSVTTAAGRHAAQTHCIRGHPFDETNTIVSSAGRRACKTCHRALIRASRRMKALA